MKTTSTFRLVILVAILLLAGLLSAGAGTDVACASEKCTVCEPNPVHICITEAGEKVGFKCHIF